MSRRTSASAHQMLARTSRTFLIPISGLPPGLREAVTAAYLCMRAIDEIEDHDALKPCEKATLLHGVRDCLHPTYVPSALKALFAPHAAALDEVTLRLHDWITLSPPPLTACVCAATATMSERMAEWSAAGWDVRTEADLDRYTFDVAGAVGVLLREIWVRYDGITTSRDHAIGLGRGLQAVNILRNRDEDLARGVDFFPDGWDSADVQTYARANLLLGDRYIGDLQPGPVRIFCKVPLALGYATLDAMLEGEPKLTRSAVVRIVREARCA